MFLSVCSRLSTTVRLSRRWSAISLAFSNRVGLTSTTWSWVVVWILTTLLPLRRSVSRSLSRSLSRSRSRGSSLMPLFTGVKSSS